MFLFLSVDRPPLISVVEVTPVAGVEHGYLATDDGYQATDEGYSATENVAIWRVEAIAGRMLNLGFPLNLAGDFEFGEFPTVESVNSLVDPEI